MTDRVTLQIADGLLSAAGWFSTSYEKSFTPTAAVQYAQNNYPLAIGCTIAYMVIIFGGQYLMKDRKPFDLRIPLAMWNALLSIFSFIGMCRTIPFLFGMIMSMPYEDTVCMPHFERVAHGAWAFGPTGFWSVLFIFSKIPELVDTIFIVLRKKPLIFLHWYHHVTVLLFCWNSMATNASAGIYFVAMNFTVHAMMYGYYCLQALGVCPKSFPAHLITLSQIAQMFIGTFVCGSAWYFSLSGRPCANDRSNLIAGGLMYASYLYLFCEFAFRRYSPKKGGKGKGKTVVADGVAVQTQKLE